MPRTAGKRGPKRLSELDPVKQYEKLHYHDKFICWQYYQFIATEGKDGWNTSEAGSVYHQRSSDYLCELGSSSWFRHRAKSMVTLAQAFAKAQKAPTKPTPPPVAEEPYTSPAATRRRVDSTPPAAPVVQETTPSVKKTPARRPTSSTIKSPPTMSHQADIDVEKSEFPSCPTNYGIHKEFDYKTRTTTTRILIRMILHSGIQPEDVDYEWITPRQIQLRIAWPVWFQKAEEMALFTTDESGNIAFPPEHQVTMDTSERNEGLVEEDGRVWDSGVLRFKQDMNTDIPLIEILTAKPNEGESVKVLQMYLTCAPLSETPGGKSKSKIKQVRNVNIGSGHRGTKRGGAGPDDQAMAS